MKRTAMWVVGLAFLVACSGGSTDEPAPETMAPATAPAVPAAMAHTLTGEFVWTQPEDGPVTGDIEAVFTPTAEGKFAVVFHFVWEGESKTWTGTAEGSLTDGELQGEVNDDAKENTFTFKGTVEGGKFSGTHAYHGDEGVEDTGRLTLSS